MSFLRPFAEYCNRKPTGFISSRRYDSDGHLINVTLPTGEVSGYHGTMDSSVRVDCTSNRGHFTTITNHTEDSTVYTLRQGVCVCV